MIRANLIKSFQADGGKKRPHIPASMSLILLAALGEGRLLEMKHGGRKKGLVYIEKGRPSVLLQVAKFRENSTNEDCNKRATSEFFMPASRGYGKKQLPLAVVYFLCTFYIFLLPSLSRSPIFYIILPSATFRFPAPFTLSPLMPDPFLLATILAVL